MSEKWEDVDPNGDIPEYIRAYADGYIDAVADAGVLELVDRHGSPERDHAREAARHALENMMARTLTERLQEALGDGFGVNLVGDPDEDFPE